MSTPGPGRITLRAALPGRPQVIAVASGFGSVWAVETDAVRRLDPGTGRTRARIAVGGKLFNIWIGAGSVWTADDAAGAVVRVNPRTNRIVARYPVGDGPSDIVFAGSTAYVINHRDRGLVRIDAVSGRVDRITTLAGDAPERMELLGGRLWVTGRGTDLLEVDPATGVRAPHRRDRPERRRPDRPGRRALGAGPNSGDRPDRVPDDRSSHPCRPAGRPRDDGRTCARARRRARARPAAFARSSTRRGR